MKKFFVLAILFLLPIVAYLFFASGVNQFAKLPVLTKNVASIKNLESNQTAPVTFQNKISVVAFFGNDLDALKGNTFNLDQKILQKFYGFDDFQFVLILPKQARKLVEDFAKEFSGITNSEKWKFVYGTPSEIQKIFNSFKTNHQLDKNLQCPYVFIVDKNANLRGRDDDEDAKNGVLYGYDSRNIAELSNKMNDDVKVILAEYRLELKKYNKKISRHEE